MLLGMEEKLQKNPICVDVLQKLLPFYFNFSLQYTCIYGMFSQIIIIFPSISSEMHPSCTPLTAQHQRSARSESNLLSY